ncbi:hypothetical protein [Gemmiger sp. An50]|uniref:hypothetical protein n=1 Tax=Gemmiger sp. An50 TaxID=1965639 RepID=UPI000B37F1E6|nr:hypothetical protein [Gemmiger sp. An50]OUN86628.1 hypothetical protein B5G03_07120 [Gemmiger sp. An50]
MTNLERRALMGEKQAQEECTLHGVVLACPKCFKPVTVRGPEDWQPTFHDPDSGGDPYSFECKCGLAFSTYKYDFKEALSDWNTRPAPPIGRCGECDSISFSSIDLGLKTKPPAEPAAKAGPPQNRGRAQ